MSTTEKVIIATIVILLLYFAVKNIVVLTIYPKKIKYKKGTQTDKIPVKNPTPTQAAFIYYYNKNILNRTIMENVITAMLFSLVQKGFITMEKSNNTINITLPKIEKETIHPEEKILYEILEQQANPQTKSLTLDELANYIRKNGAEFSNAMNHILIKAKMQAEKDGKYKEKIKKDVDKYVWLSVLYTAMGFISLCYTNLIILMAVFNGLLCSLIAYRLNNLTTKGMEEKNKWLALEAYLKDLPHKDVRKIPTLLELEEHYIYMIAFGKEKEIFGAIHQTYQILPETEKDKTYTYMHLLYQDPYYLKEIKQQIQAAYQEVYKQNKAKAPEMYK